jgi:hypothetical protein
VGIQALALDRLQVMAPGLRVSGNSPPAAQVRALIAQLLASDGSHRRVQAIMHERMVDTDVIDWMSGRAHVLQPKYVAEAARVLHLHERLLTAATRPSFFEAHAVIGPTAPSPDHELDAVRIMHSKMEVSMSRFINTDFRILTERRMTAVCLAARLYQVEHDGRWPRSLEALVPDYLPAVPLDPFSATGAPLGYLPAREGTRPVVYSVGADDFVNDTPDESVLPDTPTYGWNQGKDQWRDISRFTPPPPPTAPTTPEE